MTADEHRASIVYDRYLQECDFGTGCLWVDIAPRERQAWIDYATHLEAAPPPPVVPRRDRLPGFIKSILLIH